MDLAGLLNIPDSKAGSGGASGDDKTPQQKDTRRPEDFIGTGVNPNYDGRHSPELEPYDKDDAPPPLPAPAPDAAPAAAAAASATVEGGWSTSLDAPPVRVHFTHDQVRDVHHQGQTVQAEGGWPSSLDGPPVYVRGQEPTRDQHQGQTDQDDRPPPIGLDIGYWKRRSQGMQDAFVEMEAEYKALNTKFKRHADQTRKERRALQQDKNDLERTVDRLKKEIEERDAKLSDKEALLQEGDRHIAALQKELKELRHSTQSVENGTRQASGGKAPTIAVPPATSHHLAGPKQTQMHYTYAGPPTLNPIGYGMAAAVMVPTYSPTKPTYIARPAAPPVWAVKTQPYFTSSAMPRSAALTTVARAPPAKRPTSKKSCCCGFIDLIFGKK